jgi:hypothetical protein
VVLHTDVEVSPALHPTGRAFETDLTDAEVAALAEAGRPGDDVRDDERTLRAASPVRRNAQAREDCASDLDDQP